MRATSFAVMMGAAILVGCDHDLYKIVMVEQDGRLERTVTVWHVGSSGGKTGPASGPARTDAGASRPATMPVSAEVLDRLAKLYPQRPGENVFRGVFTDKLPAGTSEGVGQYARIATQMGTLSAYTERFRGDDDQAGVIEAQFKAIDRLTDILLGWATAQWGERKEFPKVKTFIDRDLRKDLKNVQVILWMQNTTKRILSNGDLPADKQLEWMAARAAQYFTERGYLMADDVPKLLALPNLSGEERKLDATAVLLRGFLAGKVGLTDKAFADEIVSLLKKPDDVKDSFAKYLRTTPEWKKAVADWQKAKADNPDAPEPKEMAILEQLSGEGFYWDVDFSGSEDEVDLALDCPAPMVTNGQWDRKEKRVTRRFRLSGQPKMVPVICYAAWARPDEKFQARHFGKTVLEDKNLAMYCLWRKGLGEAEGRQWDAFIGGLKPGSEVAAKLEAFHFAIPATGPTTAGAVEPATQPAPVPEKGAMLILDGLNATGPGIKD